MTMIPQQPPQMPMPQQGIPPPAATPNPTVKKEDLLELAPDTSESKPDAIDKKYAGEKNKKVREQLVENLNSIFTTRKAQLKPLHEIMYLCQQMYGGENIMSIWPDAPEMVVNITQQHCNTAIAKIWNALSQTPVLLNYRARTPDAEDKSERFSRMVQRKVYSDPANMKELMQSTESSQIYGSGIIRLSLCDSIYTPGLYNPEDLTPTDKTKPAKKEEKPKLSKVQNVKFDAVRPDRIYLDPEIANISRQAYVIEESFLTDNDLKYQAAQGNYDEETVTKIIKEAQGYKKTDENKIGKNHVLYDLNKKSNNAPTQHHVLDIYKYDGWLFTVVDDTYLTRAVYIPFFDQGGAPFIMFKGEDEPFFAYGYAIPMRIFSQQVDINISASLLLQQKLEALFPAKIVNTKGFRDCSKPETIEAGQIVYCNTDTRNPLTNIVGLVPTNQAGIGLNMQTMDTTMAIAKEMDGINDTIMGIMPNTRSTATQQNLVNMNAHTRLGKVINDFTESFKHMGVIIQRMMREIMKNSAERNEWIRSTGYQGGVEWYLVNKEDSEPDYDIEPGIDPLMANPDVAIQHILILFQNQLIMQRIPDEGIDYLIRRIFKYMGLSAENIVGPASVMKEIMGDIGYMKQYGVPATVNKMSNHELHLIVKGMYFTSPELIQYVNFRQALASNMAQHLLDLQDQQIKAGKLAQPIYLTPSMAESAVNQMDFSRFSQQTGIQLNGGLERAGQMLSGQAVQTQMTQMQGAMSPQAMQSVPVQQSPFGAQ